MHLQFPVAVERQVPLSRAYGIEGVVGKLDSGDFRSNGDEESSHHKSYPLPSTFFGGLYFPGCDSEHEGELVKGVRGVICRIVVVWKWF
jgi:hypothetical protein